MAAGLFSSRGLAIRNRRSPMGGCHGHAFVAIRRHDPRRSHAHGKRGHGTRASSHAHGRRGRGTHARFFGGVALALLAVALGGCLAPQSRVNALQTQNRALTEQNRAQLAEIENLKIHSRNIENQLRRTEEELALLDERAGLDGRQLADFRRDQEAIRQQLRAGDPAAAMPPELSRRLAAISQSHPEMQFDSRTGIAKLDTDVLFDSGEVELKPGAEKVLAELARTLGGPEGRDLRLFVVGHTDDRQVARRPARERFPTNFDLSTARALAVARRLEQLGVDPARMGVAGFGSHQPVAANVSEANRRMNRRVELFVMAPNVPVVGWTETIPSLY